MAEEEQNSATTTRSGARRATSAASALVGSLALHAAVAIALGDLRLLPSETPQRVPPLQVELRRPSEPVAAEPPADPARRPPLAEPPPEPEPRAAPEPIEPVRAEPPEPAPVEVPAPESPPSEPEVERAEPELAAESPPPEPDETRAPLPRDIDWEAARRRAAREIVEQHALEQRYPSFSLEDLDEPAAPEEPGPERSVFESDMKGPSLLSSSKARGRAGRWLAEKCERITGGISLFGLVGLCGPSHARSDLFASIKPEYLKARPVCTELADEVLARSSGTPKKTHDCRLVVMDDVSP